MSIDPPSLDDLLYLDGLHLATDSLKSTINQAYSLSGGIRAYRRESNWDLRNFEFEHFLNAWAGVAFRFRACEEHNTQYSKSFAETHGEARGGDLYQEEAALFGFFTNGLSAIESLFYGLYALGALIIVSKNPASLPPISGFLHLDPNQPENLRNVTPKNTVEAYEKRFPNSPLTDLLRRVITERAIADKQYRKLEELRNILSHRVAAAARTLGYSSLLGSGEPPDSVRPWATELLALGSDTTATPFKWLQETLNACLVETEQFVRENTGNLQDTAH